MPRIRVEKTVESSTDIYSIPGFKRAFVLRDVFFVYIGKRLYHFQGQVFGWTLWKTFEMPEDQCDNHIYNWLKG